MNALSTPETLQQSLQARLRERLSDQDVADFQRDGVVCIRQLLSPDEVALLRDGIDANLAT
ncbi:MAG: phytanoyl-CoA dioxygenase, partial [Rhodoferax sp.]|nr:phytanoyl-CoA dioxygenase [Rhodoferax sp.]